MYNELAVGLRPCGIVSTGSTSLRPARRSPGCFPGRRRDLLPGAGLTALGLVVLMVVSSYVMQFWVDLYARDYGGLGVVLALYFWIALSSAVIVWAASLSPALADRRDVRRAA